METSQLAITAVLPIFIVIASGTLVRKLGWLDIEADRSLMRVVVNLLYPCLIFDFILVPTWLHFGANIHQNQSRNQSQEASTKVIDVGIDFLGILAPF